MTKTKRPTKVPLDAVLYVRMSQEMKAAMQRAAYEQDISETQAARRAIAAWLRSLPASVQS